MMVEQPKSDPLDQSVEAAVSENRNWFMIQGIVLIVLGLLAVGFPLMTTIAAKTFLGWLLLIGGIVQIVHAFSAQKWSAFFLSLLVGGLYVFCSGWLARHPAVRKGVDVLDDALTEFLLGYMFLKTVVTSVMHVQTTLLLPQSAATK